MVLNLDTFIFGHLDPQGSIVLKIMWLCQVHPTTLQSTLNTTNQAHEALNRGAMGGLGGCPKAKRNESI